MSVVIVKAGLDLHSVPPPVGYWLVQPAGSVAG